MATLINNEKMYTKEQMDIEILKSNHTHLFRTLERIESHQKWILGVVSSGFLGLLGLIAHGFKWIG